LKTNHSEESLLSIEDLGFRWSQASQETLAISRLQLQQGETAFLYGPSGCGKSTLLSLVGGVLTANRGTVRFLGHDWQQLSSSQRDRLRADHVGFIFQQFNLLPYLSVLDNVLLASRFSERRTLQSGQPLQTAQRLLEQVGIHSTEWGRKASDLSVGQQQRVAAARALIGRPDLVIADEPTSALDEALRESFMNLLLQTCAEAGSALLFVSHDARLASRFHRQIDLTSINEATAINEATP
jgi:putative ABC transport system ATP-binding protein